MDVILVHGQLREGDKIVMCGLNGAIVSHIRSIFVPQSLSELRIASTAFDTGCPYLL